MGDLSTKKVIVVGGGFAGLTAATELSLHDGISVTLVEAADYLGRTGFLLSYLFLLLYH